MMMMIAAIRKGGDRQRGKKESIKKWNRKAKVSPDKLRSKKFRFLHFWIFRIISVNVHKTKWLRLLKKSLRHYRCKEKNVLDSEYIIFD